jgi:FKBP-type peptidyl-prolyl cis-trans isomerase
MRGITILLVLVGLLACGGAADEPSSDTKASGEAPGSSAGSGKLLREVPAPFDVKTPPADAIKTESGLRYKKLVANESGLQARRNDTVLVHYTGWKQNSGETFFTTRGRAEPMPLNLSQTAPGFTEGLQLLRKGEKAVLWVPPEIGYKSDPQQGREALVYEFEIIDVQPAPVIPPDVAKPPDSAKTLKSGTKYLVVRPGTSPEKPRYIDNVTFHYTAWDPQGRMIDTTETRRRPVTAQPLKQNDAMHEILTSMSAGERARFWVDAERMIHDGKPVGGVERGLLCYEVEVTNIAKPPQEPPPTPPDVARPPPNAKKTAKGVYYRVIKTGTSNERVRPEGSVKVHYTGWTTDGKIFDSSTFTGDVARFNLTTVIPGWSDTIPQMQIGDHWILWIPEELAYKGAPGKPKGMLVFDLELVELVRGSH